MQLGHRHQMLRRRGQIKSPASERVSSPIDALAYLISITNLVVTTDQIRLVWVDHNVAGVSLLTWAFYAIGSCIWCIYGYIHKDNVLFLTSVLWIIANGLVAIGVVIYQ